MTRLILPLIALLATRAFAEESDPLRAAQKHHESRKYTAAIAQARTVAGSAKAKARRRYQAFRLIAECYDALGCPREAIATYQEAIEALGRESPYAGALVGRAAYVCTNRLGSAAAAFFLESALAELDLAKLPPEDAAGLLARLAEARSKLGQYRAALHTAHRAIGWAEKAGTGSALIQATVALAGLETRLGRLDEARALLEGLEGKLKDRYAAQSAANAAEELVKALVAAGKTQAARAFTVKMLALLAPLDASTASGLIRRLFEGAPDAETLGALASLDDQVVGVVASDSVLPKLVPVAMAAGQVEEFVGLCVRAMLARPLDEGGARACLRAIAAVRMQQGRLGDALAAAWAHYAVTGFDESRSSRSTEFAQAVGLLTHALRARDGHLAGANALGRYQLYGPNGPDRRAGTPDDLAHPLKGVAFRPNPQLDGLFEAALKAQPVSYEGHRRRAWIYLLWCKPGKALGELKRAFALCSLEPTAMARAAQDVALGLKALNATPAGMDAFATFQRYGPNGPDGRAGTADDLKDPLGGF